MFCKTRCWDGISLYTAKKPPIYQMQLHNLHKRVQIVLQKVILIQPAYGCVYV